MAQGDGGIEPQIRRQLGGQKQHHQAHDASGGVAAQGLHQGPQPPEYAGEQVLAARHGQHHGPHQRCQHRRQDAPRHGHDELGPDQLAAAHRQGEHQIALVGHQVLIEPVHHQHQGQQQHAEGGEGEQRHKQRPENGQDRALGIAAHQGAGDAGAACRHQQQGVYRQHDAPGGPELVFQQLTQHSGTPPGTARPRCIPFPGGSGPPTAAEGRGPC